MLTVLIITIVMCICLIASILLNPNIKIGKVEIGTYWIISSFGALVLILFKCISFKEIGAGLTADTSINPLKILVLFLSMTLQSIFLDELGLFRYCANIALKKSNGSQKKLFFYLYVIVAILTVFTSNDIIILTFTPFICYFSKNAKINPIPFLFTEFVAANTWSMMLVIGNPTNVYLSSAHGITFAGYTSVMAIPTIIGGLAAMGILYLIFRKEFVAPVSQNDDDFQIKDKGLLILGGLHLGLCTLLLVISSYLGIEMWLITFCFAVSLFVTSSIYILIKKKSFIILANCTKRIPWELIPFVISMFIFVLSIDSVGLAKEIGHVLGEDHCVYTYGIVSFLTANLVNNIPMSVLFSTIVNNLSEANLLKGLFAAIIGSNLGAFFTPVGALAGIMWTGILKKHEVKFSFSTYVKYGAMVSIPTLLVTLTVLTLILGG